MKVINTVYGDATGGRWQAMLNISDTLEVNGHQVILLRGEENKHLSSGSRPIYVIPNTGFYSINAALKVRNFLQEQQPDVIIAHSGKAVWLFKNAQIGMSRKIPVIAVNHSHNVKRSVRADAFIHITPHIQELVKSLLTAKQKTTKMHRVISNLIHLPEESALPQPLRNPVTIAMLTRMIPNKGVHVLIEAIHLLNQKNIQIKAILAGDGENKAEYEKMVQDFCIEHLVQFPGWVNAQQKIEIYHAADMIAIPSLNDIQPLGILDAFGWGKVVLSSDHVGPLQVCKHRENAWVTKVGDSQDLANGIEYLIRNPDFALQLAQHAKKEALEKYCFEQIAKEHNNFIHDVYHYYN
ncbi:glycosyltransferase family 4 protein [Acinetobacter nosocomialis]|uniref:glycosyltransferase family 4 protein n=1 Tax=Acinetobacter nosocomialis TaxID=106654 RepID=UPI00057D8390|nr:glycosyltransferase family 4 protein [Acinetobacter nosocomialis]AJB47112.1 glycosyl transferase family 1 [Acinetobacter nosocomialis]MBR7739666.1 glycosyltransferase family 4 protein [Acinetobacter nosocomialis]MBR7750692.1 glycosyltransferase family 4 protein [Acinetobacter nosocomialis]MDO7215412.1 glycosyltransferase family 4 protein [Acinetobacter nosocomialis]MDO7437425.1 glycosyltransferase family 4 protein [Acinetobacter nosocomialis]